METYIVRIYRRDNEEPSKIVGVLEGVEDKSNKQKIFHTAEELLDILTGKKKTYHEDGVAKSDRRRMERLKLKLPVRIKGTNAYGKKFTEEATLQDLSSGGALFLTRNSIKKNDMLQLLIDPACSSLKKSARVVRLFEEETDQTRGVGVFFKLAHGLHG